MAGEKSFRSAFRGFNREDVVHYIEYITNKHSAQLEQLNNQLRSAREELAQLKAASDAQAELKELQERYAALKEAMAQYKNAAPEFTEADELEIYRRAERTERAAKDRAAQIYAQANAVLADATVKVDAAASTLSAQLQGCIAAADSAKEMLQGAADAMYAIRPEE